VLFLKKENIKCPKYNKNNSGCFLGIVEKGFTFEEIFNLKIRA